MGRGLEAAIASGLALGCSDRAIPDVHDDASGDGSSSGSTSTSTTTTTATTGGASTTTSTSTSGVDVETGMDTLKFDIGLLPDISVDPSRPDPLDCRAPPPSFLHERMTPCAGTDPNDPNIHAACGDPGDGMPCPAPDDPWARNVMETCVCSIADVTCGPVPTELGECCYWARDGGGCAVGRPFVVDGEARVADTTTGTRWIDPTASVEHDEVLAAAWLHDARTEHAAIASFARFAMQLLAIGAPPRFVAAASRAALDELAHARLFFTLATRHGASAREPAALDVEGALHQSEDLVAIVLATVREGCVAETISALQLAAARDGASDPWLRGRLEEMLAQELDHVELAWSFVAWALARGDHTLHMAVGRAFADALRWIPRAADIDPPGDAHHRWRRAGRLPPHDRLAIARATIEQVVWPAASSLLRRTLVDARA
jgi:hypothetical protein